MKVWCIDPQSGGIKIPPNIQKEVLDRVVAHSLKCPWNKEFQIKIRFNGQFCYLDASENGSDPFPIGRLRYFGKEEWSLAFYTYSNEKYQPCVFKDGEWYGTIEQAIDICSTYLI
jgi:hypothetical protein